MDYTRALRKSILIIDDQQKLIDKLRHAGEQLIRYAEAVIDDDYASIEYTSGVELEWLQAIKQWEASGGKMPDCYERLIDHADAMRDDS